MTESLESARRDGRLPNDDAVLAVFSSVVDTGPAEASRAIDIRAWRGIDLRVLPDRGFDIGQAWYRGDPLAWVSEAGETAPLDDPRDFDWGQAFGGGLMVTCGLRNVGMPSEGHGLHGNFSHLQASDVEVSRSITADDAYVSCRALVTDVRHPSILELERVIRTHAVTGRVEVVDTTTNLGPQSTETPLLYHFNFGFPLWSGGARVQIDSVETIPRDEASKASIDSWQEPPKVVETQERVLEHVVRDRDGWGLATLVNERLRTRLDITWRVAELPRLHQWVNPSPGMYVLGIEPANCSTKGRAHDRAEGRLPELGPGEARETALVVEASPL